jgi:phosphate transport system protein
MSSRGSFHDALDERWADLVEMTELDTLAIEQATQALLDADRDLAETVMAGQQNIDRRREHTDEQVVQLIALQAPVARDLRLLVGALGIAASLARMGGLAAHIAKTTLLRAPEPAVPLAIRSVFEQIGQTAITTARDLRTALLEQDAARAAAIETIDDAMDALHRRLFVIVLDPGWPHGTEAAIDASLLGRFYERFGDQAVSVGRRIHYIVEGTYPPA